jgi:putative membrane-bound dehydrogenase-like protein
MTTHRFLTLAIAAATLPLAPLTVRPLLAADALVPIGVARQDVTPADPIRLTGYAVRKTPSAGVEQQLWAKALALGGDADGPALLLTLDNCGIAAETYRELADRLARKARLNPERLAVACSHTHTGPCTANWAPNIFAQDIPPEHQAVIDRYTRDLLDKLEAVALAALKDRRPGRLSWSQGSVGFAHNRRVVVGNTANFGDNQAGPVDHALPVLKGEDASGKLRALVANYACHCTTLGGEFNKVCGDWAGYAQEALEREHPGAVAFITIGCGADANPSPRGGADGGLALARQHGEALAAEVKRLLAQNFTPLTATLAARMKTIELPFAPHFTREQWQRRATNSGIVGYHAKKWLARLDRGEPLPATLYYPVVTWHFGDELALVFLPGEVVVDYALRLKKEFDAARLWVTAYANYVPCYIPSRRILSEGGYEAEGSLWYYDRPQRLAPETEDLILRTLHELLPASFRFDAKKAEFPAPKTPAQALAAFRTRRDFIVEPAAAEPLIASPVAIDWDARGRLWVCEMYDYPTGVETSGSAGILPANSRPASRRQDAGAPRVGQPTPYAGHEWGKNPPDSYTPGGRIKILSSTKNDGRYDKATVFLDKLPFPTGVFPWRNGALICAAPDILFAEDTNGDGRADAVRTNFTGFATHNYQARVNGFRWGLDGWLHGSSGLFGGTVKSLLTGQAVDLGGRDFRIRPDTGELEPLAGISQFGRVRDDFDNWFGNDNSTLLWHYPLPDHYLRRNPHVTYPDPRVNVAAGVSRLTSTRNLKPGTSGGDQSRLASAATDPNKVFPISRTLERFNDPQMANRVTSACGPEIYRDDLLGAEYHGNAFICEPVHNLVTRLVLEPDGVTFAGRRADDEQRGEFLASTDNWFRPVQVRTGPDGALWVVDMYRFVIEHPRWIPPERLKQLDVRAGADMGRIYRVYPRGAKLRPVRDLTKLAAGALAEALNTPNGPTRDRAHQALLARGFQPAPKRPEGHAPVAPLAALATNAARPAVQVHALAALAGSARLEPPVLLQALADADFRVRRAAIRQCEPLLRTASSNDVLLARVLALADDPDARVRLQLALSLGERIPQRTAAAVFTKLARSKDAWMRAAVLSSVARSSGELLEAMLASPDSDPPDGEFLSGVIATAVESDLSDSLSRVFHALAPQGDVFADARAAATLELWRVSAITTLFEALERRFHRTGRTELRLTDSAGDAPRRIESVKRRAVLLAKDAHTAEPLRRACIRLLGVWGHEVAMNVLARDVLAPHTPLPVQLAALDALARSPAREGGALLLGRWPTLSPQLRGRAIDALLGRDEWSEALLGALEQRAVSVGEVNVAQRQRLLAAKNPALRERAASLFGTPAVTSRADVLAKFGGVADCAGQPDRGLDTFEKNCAPCHAWRGRGHAVGPNLAEFAGKSVADFVLAILDPNAAINPNFIAYNVETRDGRDLTGIVRGETASGLTLVQGGGVEEKILRADIQEIRASPHSLMPEGLEQALTPQDLADLIAWIKQGAPAPFGGASPEQAARARAEFLQAGANGVAKVVSAAEQLDYPSWLGRLPLPHCRQTDGQSRLVWQTAPVPASLAPGATHVFRLPAAMGFLSQPSGKFALRLNGRAVLDFNVTLADQTWQSADGHVRMSYTVRENNAEDSNGVLVLEVAARLLAPGQPATWEVIGSAAGSQRWFGVYLAGQ